MIEHHVSLVVIFVQLSEVLQRVFLCLFEITHQRAGRPNAEFHPADAECIQTLHLKMLQQRRARAGKLEARAVLHIDMQRRRVLGQRCVGDNLLGHHAHNFVLKPNGSPFDFI